MCSDDSLGRNNICVACLSIETVRGYRARINYVSLFCNYMMALEMYFTNFDIICIPLHIIHVQYYLFISIIGQQSPNVDPVLF